jgi:hypothetical protein
MASDCLPHQVRGGVPTLCGLSLLALARRRVSTPDFPTEGYSAPPLDEFRAKEITRVEVTSVARSAADGAPGAAGGAATCVAVASAMVVDEAQTDEMMVEVVVEEDYDPQVRMYHASQDSILRVTPEGLRSHVERLIGWRNALRDARDAFEAQQRSRREKRLRALETARREKQQAQTSSRRRAELVARAHALQPALRRIVETSVLETAIILETIDQMISRVEIESERARGISRIEIEQRRTGDGGMEAAERRAHLSREAQVEAAVRHLIDKVVRINSERHAEPDAAYYAACIGALGAYVRDCGGEEGMVAGWRVKQEVRMTGNSAGTTDLYYFDRNGRKFRSAKEIAIWLGLQPSSGHKMQVRRYVPAETITGGGSASGGGSALGGSSSAEKLPPVGSAIQRPLERDEVQRLQSKYGNLVVESALLVSPSAALQPSQQPMPRLGLLSSGLSPVATLPVRTVGIEDELAGEIYDELNHEMSMADLEQRLWKGARAQGWRGTQHGRSLLAPDGAKFHIKTGVDKATQLAKALDHYHRTLLPALLHQRIEVYWPLDDQWYAGQIVQIVHATEGPQPDETRDEEAHGALSAVAHSSEAVARMGSRELRRAVRAAITESGKAQSAFGSLIGVNNSYLHKWLNQNWYGMQKPRGVDKIIEAKVRAYLYRQISSRAALFAAAIRGKPISQPASAVVPLPPPALTHVILYDDGEFEGLNLSVKGTPSSGAVHVASELWRPCATPSPAPVLARSSSAAARSAANKWQASWGGEGGGGKGSSGNSVGELSTAGAEARGEAPPLTADEARAAAAAEGLELVPSSSRYSGQTGFKGVIKNGGRYAVTICKNGKPRYLGTFATPEEAALCYARHIGAERAAAWAAEARVAAPQPLTADEARAAAAAEGLELVPSSVSETGFKGVTKSGFKYMTNVSKNGKQRYLGTFATPEEAALCCARYIGAKKAAAALRVTRTSPPRAPAEAAEARVAVPQPLTADEARAAAAAEGLELVLSSSNETGFKGVTKFKGKYKTTVSKNGTHHYLGAFATPEEAALRYARYIGAKRAAAEARVAVPQPLTAAWSAASAISRSKPPAGALSVPITGVLGYVDESPAESGAKRKRTVTQHLGVGDNWGLGSSRGWTSEATAATDPYRLWPPAEIPCVRLRIAYPEGAPPPTDRAAALLTSGWRRRFEHLHAGGDVGGHVFRYGERRQLGIEDSAGLSHVPAGWAPAEAPPPLSRGTSPESPELLTRLTRLPSLELVPSSDVLLSMRECIRLLSFLEDDVPTALRGVSNAFGGLNAIREQLAKNAFGSAADFVDVVRRVWAGARAEHPPTSSAHQAALRLALRFEQLLQASTTPGVATGVAPGAAPASTRGSPYEHDWVHYVDWDDEVVEVDEVDEMEEAEREEEVVEDEEEEEDETGEVLGRQGDQSDDAEPCMSNTAVTPTTAPAPDVEDGMTGSGSGMEIEELEDFDVEGLEQSLLPYLEVDGLEQSLLLADGHELEGAIQDVQAAVQQADGGAEQVAQATAVAAHSSPAPGYSRFRSGWFDLNSDVVEDDVEDDVEDVVEDDVEDD